MKKRLNLSFQKINELKNTRIDTPVWNHLDITLHGEIKCDAPTGYLVQLRLGRGYIH